MSDRDVEDFTADAAPAAARARALRRGGGGFSILPYFMGSVLVAGGLLSVFAYSMLPHGLLLEEGGERWRFRVIRQYLAAAAEREGEPQRPEVSEVEENREGSTGTRARLLAGKLGAQARRQPNGRSGVERQSVRSERRLARSTSLDATREFGLIGLLREDVGSSHPSSAPWRDPGAAGSSDANAIANMWGSELRDPTGPADSVCPELEKAAAVEARAVGWGILALSGRCWKRSWQRVRERRRLAVVQHGMGVVRSQRRITQPQRRSDMVADVHRQGVSGFRLRGLWKR